ncbi:mitochondrial ribosomal subunit protein-domain-containing protein [Microdochium bolleyi]|uniref:Mitochondrial ribosomal subunit protein-domain-containing protein n=1 Tax=Microdochium bolleyi TaxID=196109 RepID=A0A136J1L6_9PEZI|nr:mitochondrial ribosomal subunit protein-domain-containing protein [Microdochium bolleyi]
MASCSRSLWLGLRVCARSAPSPQRTFSPACRAAARRAAPSTRRTLSTTPCRRDDNSKNADGKDAADSQSIEGEEARSSRDDPESAAIAAKLATLGPQQEQQLEQLGLDLARARSEANRNAAIKKKNDFWFADETDSELFIDESHEPEEPDHEDISTPGHAKFEQYREYREYARLAAWQLPLLSKLATPFRPPTAEEPLRFRYTTYMGETHPAENKVVVEFSPRDLPLTEPQQLKLKKLLGVRYNPETEIAKISCEQFEHQAQNKRYLGDLVDKLIVQAKDTTDTFDDVPLDTRHHKAKPKIKFPVEWRMTAERRKFIDETRVQAQLTDETRAADGTLVDGKQRIAESFVLREQQLAKEKQRIPMPAYARGGGGKRPAPRI